MVKELYNTDEIQSQKSLQDIVDTIRDFVKRNMAEMHQVQYDALSDFDEKADIAVCIKGDLGFFGGLRYLRFNSAKDVGEFHIYVYDLGTERRVVTVAISEKSIIPVDGLFNLKASRVNVKVRLKI